MLPLKNTSHYSKNELTELDFNSASATFTANSLKQKSAYRQVSAIRHVIRARNQPVFALTPKLYEIN